MVKNHEGVERGKILSSHTVRIPFLISLVLTITYGLIRPETKSACIIYQKTGDGTEFGKTLRNKTKSAYGKNPNL